MSNIAPMNFEDLANSEEFEKFYRTFYRLTKIPLALVDHTQKKVKLFCPEGEMLPVCRVVRSCEKGYAKCMRTDQIKCDVAKRERRGISYSCHAGLLDFAVPIFVDGDHVATISAGQQLSAQPTEKGYQELLHRVKSLSLDKDELHRAYFNSPYLDEDQRQAVLDMLTFFAEYFCEMGRRLQHSHKLDKYPEVTRAKDYLQKNYRETIDFGKVASDVYLSESYFSRLFKKVEGVTFSRYLQLVRIGEAKKLLEKTDWSITRIAFDVGFANLSHFNRLFREFEECTPKNYRKNITAQNDSPIKTPAS